MSRRRVQAEPSYSSTPPTADRNDAESGFHVPERTIPSATAHVQFENPDASPPTGPYLTTDMPFTPVTRSDTELHSVRNMHRRASRATTWRTVAEKDGDDSDETAWEPGTEPRLDDSPGPLYACDIRVVDFSDNHVDVREFDNEGFVEFLREPEQPWAKCRWISINGLSPDVIKAVGQHKGLHELALEDLESRRNRTKADWYPNHAFIVLTLQKLVTRDASEDESDAGSISTSRSKVGFLKRLRKIWLPSTSRERKKHDSEKAPVVDSLEQLSGKPGYRPLPPAKTLQRYHASPNADRTRFMEQHSALKDVEHNGRKGLSVMAEQVGIFLTADNTVISFFESSADDVEAPILRRLGKPGTILRESYDGSLLVQAIIDAIVDLALPLTDKYSIAIENIEIDVLTKTNIEQSIQLYTVISEINKMLSFLNPIDNLVNVLRDHRTDLSQKEALSRLRDPASGVILTPMTHTYLGDVLDHCLITTEAMTQIKQSAENLISLIFNTVSANQNESMRSLNIVSIIFLPLTFITGFFGQNFEVFPEIENNSIDYL